jgi:cytochrome P450
MLGSFIAHGLSQEEAESEVIIQMCANPRRFPLGYRLTICSMAGGDTSATAIRATLLHLIMHPHVTSKLHREFTSNPISSPIQDAEARNLPYLQAVIKEGLRIFPPVVGLMSKVVPPGGDVIDNRFVPGGTRIGYGAYGIFRDKKIWGQDADTFRPERWLDATPDMESSLELVFSYGRFQCLGKNLAMMELNKIFVEVRTLHIEAYSLHMN